MKKLHILATTCQSAGTSQLTETAQTGQGLHTFCLSEKIFGANPKEEVARLVEYLVENKIRVIIFENCWLPGKASGISYCLLHFSQELYSLGIESFFLCKGDDTHQDLSCELWRAFKPLKYNDMKEPALHIARVGHFVGSEVFDMKTGKVYPRTGGDGGWAQVQYAVREFLAFHERDWPKIVDVVKKELAL